jgi:hypothetical protein
MTQGTVTITAQVRDAAKVRQEMQATERSISSVGTTSVRANQDVAVSSRLVAEETIRLRRQQTEYRTEVARTSGEVARLAGEFVGWTSVVAAATKNSGAMVTGVRVLTAAFGPLGVAVAGTVVALKVAGDTMEYLEEKAIPAAGRSEAAMKSLSIVAERTGHSFSEAQKTIGRFDDALTTRTSLAGTVRVFDSMNVSMGRQQQLISAMRDGLVAMGKDADAELGTMALAIKRQEGELLDNMGVVSTVEQMYKNYAATLGTTADKLNQQQREEAVMQGVLQETSKYVGSATAALETYEGKASAAAVEQRKFHEEVGSTFLPLAKLVKDIERGSWALARWSWDNVLDMKFETPAERFENLMGSVGVTLPAALNRQLKADEEENVQRTIKKLQDHNANLRKLREGGYGPALPGGKVGPDEAKFYENRAKETARADEEAKRKREQAAEKARREREQEAERVASDQKRLREQLNKDLSLINKEGAERERQEAMNAHQERLKLAHDSYELMKRSRVLYYAEVAKIDKQAAEEWQRNHRMMRVDSMAEGFSSSIIDFQRKREDRAAGFAASLEPLGDLNTREQVEGEIQRLDTLAKQTSSINEQVAAMQRIENLNGRLAEMDADRAKSWEAIAASAITAAGSLASQAIRGDGVSGGDVTRGIGSVAATAASMLPVVGWAAGAITAAASDMLGSYFDGQDEAARAQQDAAEEQLRAAEIQREAARDKWEKDFGKASDRTDRFRDAVEETIFERTGRDVKGERLQNEVTTSANGLMEDITWHMPEAKGFIADGNLSMEDIEGILKAPDQYQIQNEGIVAGLQELYLKMKELNDHKDRVLPSGTPNDPVWIRSKTFEEMWGFMQKEAFFRPQGPGTRRDDSGPSGRGINVGGRR